MGKKTHWLMLLMVLVLLLAACGPEMATPTPGTVSAAPTSLPTTESAGETPASQPTAGEPAVDPDDWHVLGAADAPVTMIEYSDFQ